MELFFVRVTQYTILITHSFHHGCKCNPFLHALEREADDVHQKTRHSSDVYVSADGADGKCIQYRLSTCAGDSDNEVFMVGKICHA